MDKKADKKSGEKFQELVKTALGEQASVRSLSQLMLVECKDLDEITSKEDIIQALIEQFNIEDLDVTAIRRVRKSYGCTQIATISLPATIANKVIKAGKVKIGWSLCKLKELILPKKCFICLEYGHTARDCKNSDRSDLCRRCGEKGHIAKTCEKEPKCMLCIAENGQERDHFAGSSRCPLFRRALNSVRK